MVLVGTLGVFAGCMTNMIFLELMVKQDAGVGAYGTFLQFLFIALHGFIFTHKFGTARLNIPLHACLLIAVLFHVVNIFNNMAFNFNIPVPYHIIFRSGSLIANLILNVLMMKRSYSLKKYISVALITLGIIICTLASADDKDTKTPEFFHWWLIGIALLTTALFLSAFLGIFQEKLYLKYGKYPQEGLYYTHLISLPLFAFNYQDLVKYTFYSNTAPFFNIAPFGNVPCMWLFLAGNVITQFVCISSVYRLASVASSLTLTLVITLRKFASLLFSIIYFQNPFTIWHWLGTLLVFIGTLEFTETPETIYAALTGKKDVVQKKKDVTQKKTDEKTVDPSPKKRRGGKTPKKMD